MSKLMIIESPNKRKKLQAILGSGWRIEASLGHVRDLPVNEMGISPPDFRLPYELSGRGRDVVKRLAQAVKDADEVYLATDPDREGEAISWHLQQCLELGESYHRVAFNEITERAVKTEISRPRKIDLDLVHAQESRRAIDRLVGYMTSPVLRQASGQNLSAGRVQSPAVRLIVDREREIRSFKETKHFGVRLEFDGGWWADWDTKPFVVSKDDPYVLDRTVAEQVAKVRDLTVESFGTGTARRAPPAPFTTVSLLKAAGATLRLSPDDVMRVAQKLFEGGHITYHRTDNPNLSDEAMPAVAAELAKRKLACVSKQRRFPAPKGAQAGHPAITPTHWEVSKAGDNDQEQALYALIRMRAIACQAEDAEYSTRKVVLSGATGEGKAVTFVANGRALVKQGWLALLEGDDAEEKIDDDAEPDNPVPDLVKGASCRATVGKLLEKKTKPPRRYTEHALLDALEKLGIGRPSTYASIITKIKERDLVRVEKKYLVPTERGEYVRDALVGRCQFIEIPYTRDVEEQLDQIAAGELTYRALVTGVHAQLSKELSSIGASAPALASRDRAGSEVKCPECGKPMARRKGKYGFFWGCTGYPDCRGMMGDEKGKAVPRGAAGGAGGAPKTGDGPNCPDCGTPTSKAQTRNKHPYFRCDGCKGGWWPDRASPKKLGEKWPPRP